MTNLSLDISGKIDANWVPICQLINECANELGIPYLIVGATARDMVMSKAFNTPIKRATADIDFAVQVPNWDSFNALAEALATKGFKRSRFAHRMFSGTGIPIDIVPFGGLADKNANIHFPPENLQMNVLGFQEAYDHAYMVKLANNPDLTVKVASPEGMVLLKLIAWADRPSNQRPKDAADIGYLLYQFEEVTPVVHEMYDSQQHLLEKYDWELKNACAHYLGQRVKSIAEPASAVLINEIFTGTHRSLTKHILLGEIETGNKGYSKYETLLDAFVSGFQE